MDLQTERYQVFADQNIETGHFDVTFQFENKNNEDDFDHVEEDFAVSQELYAHSFVLWPVSKVFEQILHGPLASKGPIPIVRHSYEDFKEFISFLYQQKCNINFENVMALVDLGEFYAVQSVKDKCEEFLIVNLPLATNILGIYESLKPYTLENANKNILEHIRINAVKILKSDEFLNVKKEVVLEFITMEKLKAKPEEIFEAVCRWAEAQCPDETQNKNKFMKAQLCDVLGLFDFAKMDMDFLHSFVVRKGFLFSSYDELSDMLCTVDEEKKKNDVKNMPQYEPPPGMGREVQRHPAERRYVPRVIQRVRREQVYPLDDEDDLWS